MTGDPLIAFLDRLAAGGRVRGGGAAARAVAPHPHDVVRAEAALRPLQEGLEIWDPLGGCTVECTPAEPEAAENERTAEGGPVAGWPPGACRAAS